MNINEYDVKLDISLWFSGIGVKSNLSSIDYGTLYMIRRIINLRKK